MRLRQAELLLKLSRRVTAFETLDQVLATLIEIISLELDAERSTIFLNDNQTGELYSRVSQDTVKREIRVLNTSGVAGHVYTTGKSRIVYDAYADEYFDPDIDQ